MAPTLKEVNAMPSSSGTSTSPLQRGEINNAAEDEFPAAPLVSSCDNSNEATAVDQSETNDADEPIMKPSASSTATAAQYQQPSSTTTSPSTSTSTIQSQIQHEDSTQIPTDPTAFTHPPHFTKTNPLHSALSELEDTMRCNICREFYHAPVMLLPCCHNFCSLCVRHHFKTTYTGMKRKTECPQCNKPVSIPNSSDYQKAIIPNKYLEQQVILYKKTIREPLRGELVALDVLRQEKKLGTMMTMTNNTNGGGLMNTKEGKNAGRGKKRRGKAQKEEGHNAHGHGTRLSKRARPSKKMNYADDTEADSDEDYEDDDDDEYDNTNAQQQSNNHSYAAAASNQSSAAARNQQPPSQPPLKRKPTVSYHGVKPKKLREMCKHEGLSATGSDAELKHRHSEFITLYNAECDSEHPRTVNELIRELNGREKSIKIEANNAKAKKESKLMKSLGSSLESYHDGSIAKPSSGNADFDSKMSNNFQQMIANLKAQKKKAGGSKQGGTVTMPTPACISNIAAKAASLKSNGHASTDAVGGDAGTMAAAASSLEQKQISHASKLGRTNGYNATSPTSSVDSDKTVETPQKYPPPGSSSKANKKSSPRAKRKAASSSTVSKQFASSSTASNKKKPPTKSSKLNSCKGTKQSTLSSAMKPATARTTRITSIGPWTCPRCTFYNTENTTKKCLCAMCSSPRPVETTCQSNNNNSGQDMQVVEIDC